MDANRILKELRQLDADAVPFTTIWFQKHQPALLAEVYAVFGFLDVALAEAGITPEMRLIEPRTPEHIITALRRLDATGHLLTPGALERTHPKVLGACRCVFGSLNKALAAAKVSLPVPPPPPAPPPDGPPCACGCGELAGRDPVNDNGKVFKNKAHYDAWRDTRQGEYTCACGCGQKFRRQKSRVTNPQRVYLNRAHWGNRRGTAKKRRPRHSPTRTDSAWRRTL